MTGKKATDQWYAEIKDFDFSKKVFNGNTGHFTQVVWKGSIELGAAVATAANGWNFCVGRYAVSGNVKGKFDDNIGDLLTLPQTKDHMDALRKEVVIDIITKCKDML